MHPFLTQGELRQSFENIGFMCLNSELKDVYRDFDAEHTNYLPMDKFLDYIETISSVWKAGIVWGGEDGKEK
jgi:Ca2+-binding EF-hand superfamily protein